MDTCSACTSAVSSAHREWDDEVAVQLEWYRKASVSQMRQVGWVLGKGPVLMPSQAAVFFCIM